LGIKEKTVPWIEMIINYHTSAGMLEVKKKDIFNIYFWRYQASANNAFKF